MEHLSLDLGQCRGRWWMDRHVGEDQPLLVVALAQDFVLAQEKFVPHAESGIETNLTVKKKKIFFSLLFIPKLLFDSWEAMISRATTKRIGEGTEFPEEIPKRSKS